MSEILRVFVAILAADLVLDWLHRVRRRARMRELNRLSREAKSRKREVAQRRAESATQDAGS